MLPLEDNNFVFENVRGSYRRSSVYENDQSSLEIFANLTMRLNNINMDSDTQDDIGIELDVRYTLDSETFSFNCNLNIINIDSKAIIYSTIVSVLGVI